MKAFLVIRDRRILVDGAIIEIVVWKVPTPVPPTEHGWKYRLFYGQPGERLVGYDNERGKGDHRHVDGVELPYNFVSLGQLLDDFEADIVAMRGEPI
ncbi:MAG: toxin-antitoxin system TumE family protein [Bosea sp. (in: a-proteobacteria)]